MKKTSNTGRNRQRQNTSLRSRLTTRTIVMVSAVLLAIGALFTIATLNLSNPNEAQAAAVGDYQSVTSGDWTSTSTWARWNGSSWVNPAPSIPKETDGTITIQSGHTVSVNSTVSGKVDQVVVETGGIMDIRSGSITLGNGTGADLVVAGTLKNAATLSTSAGTTISFSAGGKYQHAFTTTAGVIPTATWDANSVCEFVGYTTNSTIPTSFNQAFGDITWNCNNQTVAFNWSTLPTSINDLTVNSTGSGQLNFSNGNVTMNISGDYTQTGGTVNVNTANSKVTTINVSGNWAHTGGTLTCGGNSSTSGEIYFNKSGNQSFTASGNTVTGNLDFHVSSGSTLDLGTSILSCRDFNVLSGAALAIGSPNGIHSSGNIGNIQTTGARIFNTSADYIFNGTSVQVTGSALPAQVRNITFDNSNGVTITNSVTVSGQLSLVNGTIVTSGNSITLGTAATAGNTGTLVRNNGRISGNFRRWIPAATATDILFPIGSSTNYNGAEFDFTTAPTTGGTILATFIPTKPDATGLPLMDAGESCMNLGFGYWQFTAGNSFAGGTYNVRLEANGMPGISDPPSLHMAQRSSAGTNWTANGTHVAGTGTSLNPIINRSGMTSLGQYGVISSGSNVLPVELLYFRAGWNNKKVDLTWATASEINNDHFTIERSADGESFVSILEIQGNGTTTQMNTYSATDRTPLSGRSYYRLKQTDFDGTYTYSDIRTVSTQWASTSGSALEVSSIYPNPCTDKFHLSYKSSGEKPVRVMLFDAQGKMMHDEEWDSESADQSDEIIDMHTMPAGTYFLCLVSGEERVSRRIVRR